MALKTIEEEWRGFWGMVAPADPSPVQVEECRRAFYAGACAMLAGMREIGEPHISEQQGEAWYRDRQRELDDWYRDLITTHARRN